MKLYEIDEAIMGCIDEETGEAIDTEKLAALEMERDIKISNIASWIKDLSAESKAIKEEMDNLSARKKADDNKIESLKNFLAYYLNGAKFKDARNSISYRHSVSTEYTGDVNTLADEYCKIERKPSLTAIKEALTSGVEIEGARLVEKESVIIK